VVEAIQFCHSQMVSHRDIKPENILIVKADNGFQIKLLDFGFALTMNAGKLSRLLVGTYIYAAPEVLSLKRYEPKERREREKDNDNSFYHSYIGPEVDAWSFGVLMYTMLVGMDSIENKKRKQKKKTMIIPF
jgi:serine/threonine protein kinase